MPVNLKNLRAAIHDFAWDKVFRASLKWTKPTDNLRVEVVDTQHYTLTPIADTGGMQVYVVRSAEGTLPPRPTRNKIETRLRRTQVEHLLIFEDATQQVAVIQWVKRGQQGRRVREFTYRRGDSGEALIQKLQGIAFEIGDFDPQGRIEISKVTARVSKNLDVEGVTKKFYEEFKRQREEFQTFLAGIPLDSDQRWYVSVMLNRLMFISFIQAKGFLNHNPDYLRERLAWSKATLGPDRYYRGFLRVLFFQGFAREPGQRGADVHQMLGTIPYLNGGLFLPHPIEEQYGDAIDIPDSAFDTLLAFFSLWRWHLSERPGTSDREIDPDVLGYIFEKYINQKQMGAYYTRDDITGYICRNTIIPALFDKADLSLAPLDLPHTIADYLYPAMRQEELLPTESEREQVARHSRVAALIADAHAGTIATINDAVTANLDLESLMGDLIPQLDAPTVYRLYTTLAGDPYAGKLPLSILDPTAGSGAFLFAALRILTPIYAAVLDRMEELVEQKQAVSKPMVEVLAAAEAHANRDYFITKSIVVRNLYGVDLMAEATEICKLRLFLRMVADLDEAKHIEPLPDIDFNIRAGNALVGYARPEEIGLVYKDKIAGLNARQQRLLEEIKAVQRELTDYRNAQLQFNPSAAEGHAAREQIRERLDTLNAGLDTDLIKIGQIRTEADGSSNTHPFHWFTAFYEIISEGGFDVIVGNPPWREYAATKKEYKVYGYKTESCGNLYGMCTERALSLIHTGGRLSFIVQLPLVSSSRMTTVRNVLRQSSETLYVATFDDRPGKLFEGLQHCRSVVFIAEHNRQGCQRLFVTRYHRWPTEFRPYIFDAIEYAQIKGSTVYPDLLPKYVNNAQESLFRTLKKGTQTLENVLTRQETNHSIFYQEATGYWVKAIVGLPYYAKNGTVGAPAHGRYLYFRSEEAAQAACAIINSSLFYAYFIAYSDCFHLSDTLVSGFPLVSGMITDARLSQLGQQLQDDLTANAARKTIQTRDGDRIEYAEFYGAQSKPIIDDIDRTLATHYG
ncbi:MAG: SAM-dependent methyltransferase, partial [Chloroflexales bacterium]